MFTSDRLKMGEFVNPVWLKVLAYVVAIFIAVLNAYLLVRVFAAGSPDVQAHPGAARERARRRGDSPARDRPREAARVRGVAVARRGRLAARNMEQLNLRESQEMKETGRIWSG